MKTFRDVVISLDPDGVFAAKRPSMLGYAYKQRDPADGGKVSVIVRAKDGSENGFDLNPDGSFAGMTGEISMDAELFNAFVLADDWEIANRAELEKARVGSGKM